MNPGYHKATRDSCILIGPNSTIIGHLNIAILYSGTKQVLRNVIFEDVFGPVIRALSPEWVRISGSIRSN